MSEDHTKQLLERIREADSATLLSWFQDLTEDLTNADEFSDDTTGAEAERGMVRNEITRRMQQGVPRDPR